MAQKRIVIVDDDPSILFYVGEILKGEGYAVQMVGSGPQALDIMQAEGIDLAILDIDMPGMDGYTLLAAMRAHDVLQRVPVIFLTVKNSVADETRGLKAGVVDFVSKDVLNPERIDILRFRVRNLFAGQENERLRGVLATIVSANHEINNPLSIISTNAQTLRLLNRDLSEKNVTKLEKIEEQVKRIAEVTERLRQMDEVATSEYIDAGPEMIDVWGKGEGEQP